MQLNQHCSRELKNWAIVFKISTIYSSTSRITHPSSFISMFPSIWNSSWRIHTIGVSSRPIKVLEVLADSLEPLGRTECLITSMLKPKISKESSMGSSTSPMIPKESKYVQAMVPLTSYSKSMLDRGALSPIWTPVPTTHLSEHLNTALKFYQKWTTNSLRQLLRPPRQNKWALIAQPHTNKFKFMVPFNSAKTWNAFT